MTDPRHEAIRQELERIAFRDATSGRQAVAKVTALRSLERLGRHRVNGSSPTDDDGRFHCGSAEWWDLDRGDSDETRERWRRAWECQ